MTTSPPHWPSWERLLAWLVVGAIAAQILASELPRAGCDLRHCPGRVVPHSKVVRPVASVS